VNIQLNRHKGFAWNEENNCFIKGYLYDKKGKFHEKKAMFSIFDTKADWKEIVDQLQELNGIYALVFQLGKFTILANDTTRAFPLFYAFQNGECIVSDEVQAIKNETGYEEFDTLSDIEFLASNHTHGKKTLLKNIFQLRSSEFLIFEGDAIIKSGFSFQYSKYTSDWSSLSRFKKSMTSVFENSFERLAQSLHEKTPVLPLSGGYDSRIIASFLKELGFENTICYTYGRSDGFEIETSKKVAEKLDFEWHFIPYTKELIEESLEDPEFHSYLDFASNFNSMPNLQEYYAVKYLKEHQLIPDNSVFIPGYAGDILFGSEYRKYNPLKESITDAIIAYKFDNHPLTDNNKLKLKREIDITLQEYQLSNKTSDFSVFDDYNFRERIAKYIFNSSHFYSFFGFEFRFPFWDLEILQFFSLVPENWKQGYDIYNKVIFPEFFEKFDIAFENQHPSHSKRPKFRKTKSFLRPIVPKSIKEKKLKERDWNNYELVTEGMLHQMQEKNLEIKRLYKDYNEIITQWYLYKLKGKL
tara:strand:+ start:12430 stop:14010 length:1581 start_codon:yes stop_codon:yes gene_type:complete